MPRKKPCIFISHIHEDADIAIGLKEYLDKVFLSFFDIFVASDGSSIRAGDNWSASLEAALKKAEMVLVLVSEPSLERRWIYFEAGGAYFMGKRVVPVCCRGLSINRIGTPLNWLQSLDAKEASGAVRLINEVASTFEVSAPSVDIEFLSQLLAGNILKSKSAVEAPQIPRRPLPLFFLLDTSGSMAGERIGLMRQGLIKLVDYLQLPEEPFLPLLSILTFGTSSNLLVPPTPVSEIRQMPEILAEGSCALGEALLHLSRIINDPALMPKRCLRPLIVLTLDGCPNDDWQSGLKALKDTGMGSRAGRLCLALGKDADYKVLREIGNLGVLPMVKPEDILGITNFFRWVSTAVTTFPDEKDDWELPPPPPGIQIVI